MVPMRCFLRCVHVAADSSKEVEGGRSKSSLRRLREEAGVSRSREEEGRAGVAQAGVGSDLIGGAASVEVTGVARRRLVLTMDCKMRLAGTLLGYWPWSPSTIVCLASRGV